MAIGAVDLGHVSYIDRMLEHGWAGTGRGALGVVHYRVALVAIPANDPAVAAHMLAVVAAEAAIEIIMAEIIIITRCDIKVRNPM